MTNTNELRTAIVGLLRSAAMEEEMLLVLTSRQADPGSPKQWAPLPTVAHNTAFKRQQVERLKAVIRQIAPPDFPEVDHTSESVYSKYAAASAEAVAAASLRTTDDLISALSALADDDLIEPSRNPWLRGRPLWLQTIVRGFWHPMGHIGDWYVTNAMVERGVALRMHAVATAEYLQAPDASRGMAWFSLACTYAALGTSDGAIDALEHASELNQDLRARIATEPELAALRTDYRVAALID